MKYKNLAIVLKDGVYTASHTNGKSISFTGAGKWLDMRLAWFDEHGTMAGY